jgi:N-acetylglutamate synthase-like GNAT family acetyltransferase
MDENRLDIICRPARAGDKPDVLELTKNIWEGHDYVPQVWDEWLADPEGKLLVAEHENKVVGVSKLTHLSEGDWWMEGLRVHPDYEGQGIASRLTEQVVQLWTEIGFGTVRLATASFRLQVQHLCTRLGFELVSERTAYLAPAIQEEHLSTAFQPVSEGQIIETERYARQSQTLMESGGLMDLGWRFAPPRPGYIMKAVQRGMAWWWRGDSGLLTVRIDEDEEGGDTPMIELLACPLDMLEYCLLDFRRLAARMGYPKAGWMAPLKDDLLPTLGAAGFGRDWEAFLCLFSKPHPTRPETGWI